MLWTTGPERHYALCHLTVLAGDADFLADSDSNAAGSFIVAASQTLTVRHLAFRSALRRPIVIGFDVRFGTIVFVPVSWCRQHHEVSISEELPPVARSWSWIQPKLSESRPLGLGLFKARQSQYCLSLLPIRILPRLS